ncbi:hypothetical protein [Salipaludibacillus sp. CF4.18]|uniref:hypothetical protein n=1 Tax=Salipaludibacillus sp. CF4.18 TaxID=3373081 RepID=UPI003EE70728
MTQLLTVKSGKRTVINMLPFYGNHQGKANVGLRYEGKEHGLSGIGERYAAELSCGLSGVIGYFRSFGLNEAYCRITFGDPFVFKTKTRTPPPKKMEVLDIFKLSQSKFTNVKLEKIVMFVNGQGNLPIDSVYFFHDRIQIAVGGSGCRIELQFVPNK